MKATKKPKRPNPVRSNLAILRNYGVSVVINRSGHMRVGMPRTESSPPEPRVHRRTMFRQPAGYYSQPQAKPRSQAKRDKAFRRIEKALQPVCSNCGERGLHFIPPSMGEPGYFYCPA